MRIILNPKYELLRSWVEHLQETFTESGEVIYDARNQIRRIVPVIDGQKIDKSFIVKRFHAPSLPNRVVYSCLREPKAARSYYNALYLLQHGVGTPEPIAFILCGKHLLRESYLITTASRLTRLNREFTLAYTPELDDTIRPLARFTAKMHNEKILHLDYSPGNILWDMNPRFTPDNGEEKYLFEVIDLNRMRVGKEVTLKEGAKSLRRLCARTSFFETFADEYAQVRNMDKDECRKWILYYRNQFWHNGKKAQYDYK